MRRPKHQPISEDEAHQLISLWMEKGDGEAAIIAGTFVEDRLGFAIKSRFVDMPLRGDVTKTLTETALFDGYGPLATFFAKIDIGFALGLYNARRRADLHLLRSIRNDFAHALEPATFLDHGIENKVSRLRLFDNVKAVMDSLKNTQEDSNKRYYLVACSYMGGYLGSIADRKKDFTWRMP